MFLFYLLIFVISVSSIIARWRLFTKAGYSGWKSIVPIYNSYVMHQIAFGKNSGILFLIEYVPIVGFAYSLYVKYCFTKSFGGGDLMSVYSMFFQGITNLFIGFGRASYEGINYNFLYNFIKN